MTEILEELHHSAEKEEPEILEGREIPVSGKRSSKRALSPDEAFDLIVRARERGGNRTQEAEYYAYDPSYEDPAFEPDKKSVDPLRGELAAAGLSESEIDALDLQYGVIDFVHRDESNDRRDVSVVTRRFSNYHDALAYRDTFSLKKRDILDKNRGKDERDLSRTIVVYEDQALWKRLNDPQDPLSRYKDEYLTLRRGVERGAWTDQYAEQVWAGDLKDDLERYRKDGVLRRTNAGAGGAESASAEPAPNTEAHTAHAQGVFARRYKALAEEVKASGGTMADLREKVEALKNDKQFNDSRRLLNSLPSGGGSAGIIAIERSIEREVFGDMLPAARGASARSENAPNEERREFHLPETMDATLIHQIHHDLAHEAGRDAVSAESGELREEEAALRDRRLQFAQANAEVAKFYRAARRYKKGSSGARLSPSMFRQAVKQADEYYLAHLQQGDGEILGSGKSAAGKDKDVAERKRQFMERVGAYASPDVAEALYRKKLAELEYYRAKNLALGVFIEDTREGRAGEQLRVSYAEAEGEHKNRIDEALRGDVSAYAANEMELLLLAEQKAMEPEKRSALLRVMKTCVPRSRTARFLCATAVVGAVTFGVSGATLGAGPLALFAGKRFLASYGTAPVIAMLGGKLEKRLEARYRAEEKREEALGVLKNGLTLENLKTADEKYRAAVSAELRAKKHRAYAKLGLMLAAGAGAGYSIGSLLEHAHPELFPHAHAAGGSPASSAIPETKTQGAVAAALEREKARIPFSRWALPRNISESASSDAGSEATDAASGGGAGSTPPSGARWASPDAPRMVPDTDLPRAETPEELVTVPPGQGVWRPVYRQLEARLHEHPDQFGLTENDLADAERVKGILNRETQNILVREGYVTPDGETRVSAPGVKIFLDEENHIRVESGGIEKPFYPHPRAGAPASEAASVPETPHEAASASEISAEDVPPEELLRVPAPEEIVVSELSEGSIVEHPETLPEPPTPAEEAPVHDAVPAEHPEAAVATPESSPIHIVQEGETLRMVLREQLDHRFPEFSNLHSEAKIYMYDAIERYMRAKPRLFGLSKSLELTPGTTIDFGTLYKENFGLTRLFEHASRISEMPTHEFNALQQLGFSKEEYFRPAYVEGLREATVDEYLKELPRTKDGFLHTGILGKTIRVEGHEFVVRGHHIHLADEMLEAKASNASVGSLAVKDFIAKHVTVK